MKKLSLVLFLTLIGSMAAYPAQVFRFKSVNYKSSPPLIEIAEIIIQESIVRIPRFTEDGSGRKEETVFTGNRLFLIDHPNQSYIVIDKESMRAMGTQVDEAMRKMEEMIKKLPKEQQEKFKKALEQKGAVSAPKERSGAMSMIPNIKVEITSELGERGGYPCEKLEVFQDGNKVREIWITRWSNFDDGDQAAEALRRMGAFFEEIRKSIPNLAGGNLGGSPNFIEESGLREGCPMETTSYGKDGIIKEKTTFESYTRRDPRTIVMPPAGYIQKKSP